MLPVGRSLNRSQAMVPSPQSGHRPGGLCLEPGPGCRDSTHLVTEEEGLSSGHLPHAGESPWCWNTEPGEVLIRGR